MSRLVVLDSALHAADAGRFGRLLVQFEEGFSRFFHGDEAESTAAWPARIAGLAPPQPLMRVVVAVDDVDGGEHVIGGGAAEYYRDAACVFVTCLYVHDHGGARRRGHGRRLLEAAHAACALLGPVDAMLAEVEWPPLLRAHGATADAVAIAHERLQFFARIGARRIDVDFVQPALAPDLSAVRYLRLLLLPAPDSAGAAPEETRLRAVVARFLPAFHAAVAQDTGVGADATALAQMLSQCERRDGRPFTHAVAA